MADEIINLKRENVAANNTIQVCQNRPEICGKMTALI